MTAEPGVNNANRASTLRTERLVKSYPGTQALKGVTLELYAGQVVGLAGHNGAGKSTLTKVLAGLEQPDAGHIALRGRRLALKTPRDALDAGISLVPQPLTVFPDLTVRQNLAAGARPEGWRDRLLDLHRPPQIAALAAAVETFGLNGILDQQAGTQRPVVQRLIMIARALRDEPSMLILDEPTANLPASESSLLLRLVRDLAETGVGVLFISHRLDELLLGTERIVVMRQGSVVHDGPSRDLDKSSLASLIVGSAIEQVGSEAPAHKHGEQGKSDQVVLETNNLSAAPRVQGIDLKLRCGEIVGIAGLEGSGRTSLLRALWGDLRVTDGEVRVNGVKRSFSFPKDALKAGLAFVPEDRHRSALFDGMSVAANVSISVLARIAQLKLWISTPVERKTTTDALRTVDFQPLRDPIVNGISGYSGGNQQKAVFARGVMSQPLIYLLDEPTQGVDVGAREQIYHVIEQLALNGTAVLLASSEEEELVRLCSRVLIMRDGRIVQELMGSELTESQIARASISA